jgi:predicted neutral ceramidase superfamily lipid hydrolase
MGGCWVYSFGNYINVNFTGDIMNKKRITFLSFFIVVIATTIVVFNNSVDLLEKLFNPVFNPLMMLSLLSLVLPTIYYVVYTWRSK